MICILDYGSGNVRSVFNVIATLSDDVRVSNDAAVIESATHIVLPGVGAFAAAMEKIERSIDLGVLATEVLEKGKPFLGICVGLQVLASTGHEFGEHPGLGWIPGTVERLETHGLPLPHVGWNNIAPRQASPLLAHFDGEPDFYFVHSYVFRPAHSGDTVATTCYGTQFTSVVSRGNVHGVQFHPEKSQKAGTQLLRNFLSLS